jgi:hypothetical protein
MKLETIDRCLWWPFCCRHSKVTFLIEGIKELTTFEFRSLIFAISLFRKCASDFKGKDSVWALKLHNTKPHLTFICGGMKDVYIRYMAISKDFLQMFIWHVFMLKIKELEINRKCQGQSLVEMPRGYNNDIIDGRLLLHLCNSVYHCSDKLLLVWLSNQWISVNLKYFQY